jgi:hypothetical protein
MIRITLDILYFGLSYGIVFFVGFYLGANK